MLPIKGGTPSDVGLCRELWCLMVPHPGNGIPWHKVVETRRWWDRWAGLDKASVLLLGYSDMWPGLERWWLYRGR